jgi:hypothetical protein
MLHYQTLNPPFCLIISLRSIPETIKGENELNTNYPWISPRETNICSLTDYRTIVSIEQPNFSNQKKAALMRLQMVSCLFFPYNGVRSLKRREADHVPAKT